MLLSSSPLLSPQLFAILRDLIEEHLGIEYRDEDLPLLSNKITTRAREAGFETVLDYYYFLRYDGGSALELEALVDALVVSETYFFRELEASRAGVHEVLVPAIARRGRARVWCAACATGEEPLSIAMLLAEANLADRCEIVATDVSARSIARARKGSYTGRSLRMLPPAPPPIGWTPKLASVVSASILKEDRSSRDCANGVASASPSGGGDATATATISPELLARIDYRNVNLLDATAVKKLGLFDLVLCRNVLIYFGTATVQRVVSSLSDALVDGASILIGASESLLRFGIDLDHKRRGGASFYVKSGGATP